MPCHAPSPPRTSEARLRCATRRGRPRPRASLVACVAACFPAVLGACLTACTDDVIVPTTEFRANGDHFEVDRDGKGFRRWLPRGMNLAIAKPGFYPGELAANRDDYLRWFDALREANVDLIRLYTLHFPVFYAALREWNIEHPATPIYVLQGIWLDEIEHCTKKEVHVSGETIGCDYISEKTEQLEEEVAYVVDAVHGDAAIPERFGKAHGTYLADVSPWLMGLLPGHEMDGYAVRYGDLRFADYTQYQGRYLRMEKGTPTEGWVARGLDLVITRCHERWGRDYPVGWSNWPALDPIKHPTEPTTFAQDVVQCDFGKFQSLRGFDRGIYVSYHVYPFNPEFIIHDPGYTKTTDSKGKVNSYLGYLLDLKAHHMGVPLLISELGIPSSMGVAHINENAYNHGGYNEVDQAAILVDQIDAAVAANAAGTIVFEWIDEWFKRTWMTNATMLPADSGRLWHDVTSPEESFGIISFWPVPNRSRVVDGKAGDWPSPTAPGSNTFVHTAQPAAVAQPSGDGKDALRSLTSVHLAYDPAYLYLKIQLGSTADATTDGATRLLDSVLLVGLSTSAGATGDRRLSELPPLQTAPDLGFELWLTLDHAAKLYTLRVDDHYDPTPLLNGGGGKGGKPETNENGLFQLASQIVNNNAQYVAEGLPLIPKKRYYQAGVLRYGDAAVDTLSHVFAGPGGVIEVRLPWHALWVTDPAGRHVLDKDPKATGFIAKPTEGIQALVLSARRGADGALTVVDAAPRAAWQPGTPIPASALPLYSWPTWTTVASVERRKPAFQALSKRYAELESP